MEGFVLETSAIDFIDGDDCVWEDKPLKTLSKNNELNAYKHYMDSGSLWIL